MTNTHQPDNAQPPVAPVSAPESEACAPAPRRRGRTVAKYAGLSVLFCAILGVLLLGVSYVLHPKNNTEAAGMMDERTYAILAEPDQTIDAVFIGNSAVATAVSPMEMWERRGVTSYVCAANGEKMTFVPYVLQLTFEHQSPQVVFLEADMLFDPSDFAHLAREILRETLPGILYHHRWCSLTWDDFTQPIRFTNSLDRRGYNAKARVTPITDTSNMNPTDAVELPSSINLELLKLVKRQCDEQGAKLVILAVPNTVAWNYARHNGTEQLAAELGIELYDMNYEDTRTPIDLQIDSRDGGNHLNYRGATKASAQLSDLLADRFQLSDHRGDAAWEPWNEALVRYHDYMERLAADPEAYDAEGAHVG